MVDVKVNFKKLPFYRKISVLLQPTFVKLSMEIPNRKLNFTLDPEQATAIAMNRDIQNSTYKVQVQLRICQIDSSCEQQDYLPAKLKVFVNENVCQLPPLLRMNNNDTDIKRSPMPINITSLVKLSPTVTNYVTLEWDPKNVNYCIAIFLVEKLNSEELLNIMKSKEFSDNYTKLMIKKNLTEIYDNEIETTLLKISLLCPLGKTRITIPCRASTCKHIQCFDALLYLKMNEKKETWKCPICGITAPYELLIIDSYIDKILKSPLSEKFTEIELNKDGSFKF